MNETTLQTQILALVQESRTPPRVQELTKAIDAYAEDIEEALGALEEQGRILRTRKGRYVTVESQGLMSGTLIANARGFGFVRPLDGGEDLFIGGDDLHGALHGDTVLVHRKKKRSDRPAGVVEQIVKRRNPTILGVYSEAGETPAVTPDDPRILGTFLVKDRYGKNTINAQEGDIVELRIVEWSGGRDPHWGKITDVISHPDDYDAGMKLVVRRNGIQEAFSKAALEQAEALPDAVQPEDMAGREDFRAQKCFTIDGADAKDFDDAVAIDVLPDGNYRLYVHIADVSHYVTENTALDIDSYQRGTSVYLINKVVPMLPEKLSNGLCSLMPGVDRLCFSCVMDVDAQSGDVIDYRIVPGVIRSSARLIYDEVNLLLEDGDAAMVEKMSGQADSLRQMRALMDVLYQRRMRRGAIDFELPEPEIELDDRGNPIRVEAAKRGVSHRMIEEFMLLANETVASHAVLMELPFLYRVHEAPDGEKIRDFASFSGGLGYPLKVGKKGVQPGELRALLLQANEQPEERLLSKVLLRAMQRARYAPENLGHYALALWDYCHFTSPIRRYPDLFIHRVLHMQWSGALDATAMERLALQAEAAAQQSSLAERAATDAERDVDQWMMTRYMVNHIGETFDGIVDGVSEYGVFVELPNCVSGMIPYATLPGRWEYDEKRYAVIGPGNARLRIGDPVRVSVTAANPQSRRIEFALGDGQQAEDEG